MSFNLLIILCCLLFLVTGLKKSRIFYVKKLALPFTGILFILGLFLFSNTAVKSAAKGIELWLNVVLPSLFPFFVVSDLMNSTGFVRAMGILLEPVMRPLFNVPGCGSFAFLMGVTSGYPVGAKITAGMREEQLLAKTEAERLLAFSNNSGPLFIIGAVSVGMFHIPKLGLFLLVCHILACITVGFLFRFYKKENVKKIRMSTKMMLAKFKNEVRVMKNQNIGGMFGDAVRNSIATLLAIGGFIIFFSVIINLLLETGVINVLSEALGLLLSPLGLSQDILTALICGFFEITTGTNMASNAGSAPFVQQLTAASMIIGWAGLSVHAQVISIVNKTDISVKPYFLGKFLQGVFASLYTFVAYKTVGSHIIQAQSAFALPSLTRQPGALEYFLTSCQFLSAALSVSLLFAVVSLIFTCLPARR